MSDRAARRRATKQPANSTRSAPREPREFAGFRPQALTFFRSLARHNEKSWFEENRDRFEIDVLQPMRALVEELDVRFARFAPEIVGDPKRSIFRIYRDVRFSADKSPYKTHASCWLTHQDSGRSVGRDSEGGAAGFYFHLQPGESLVAGGLWMPPRETLSRIRDAIVARQPEWESVVLAPGFRRRFGGLSDEGMLTRLPRGAPADSPAARWLRYTSFTASRRLSDEDVTSPRLTQTLESNFSALLPLVRWLNRALGFPEAKSRV